MRLFCYGTLQFPVILRQATGRRLTGKPARLEDYACYTVTGQVFPGICAEPGAVTPGIIYNGIGRRLLRKLDAYESDFYERSRVQVRVNASSTVPAWVYIIRPRYRHCLSCDKWDREVFRVKHMQHYLRHQRR
jgi:gamma-glutamylcyclotransferase (GGCT)/AIG2-like uncharacterized protein YtfP